MQRMVFLPALRGKTAHGGGYGSRSPSELAGPVRSNPSAGFVICHMVWSRHQNITEPGGGLDPRLGSSVVRAPGIYLGGRDRAWVQILVGLLFCTYPQPLRVT